MKSSRSSLAARVAVFLLFVACLVVTGPNASAGTYTPDGWHALTRASLTTSGLERSTDAGAPSWGVDVSDDGRFVAFLTEDWGSFSGTQLVVRDRYASTATRVASADCCGLSMSGDGSLVTVSGGVFDVETATLLDTVGRRPSISADGRYVVSKYWYGLQVLDRDTDTTQIISAVGDDPKMDAAGDVVLFHTTTALVDEDDNGAWDVYAWDRASSDVRLVSATTGGVVGDDDTYLRSVSPDGTLAGLTTRATNLHASSGGIDGIVVDLTDGAVTDLGADVAPWDFSADNATVAVGIGTDSAGAIDLASTALSVIAGPGSVLPSHPQTTNFLAVPAISADGRWIAFASDAANLVGSDTNDVIDVFVSGLTACGPTQVEVTPGDGSALVSWIPPTPDGGAEPDYKIEIQPGKHKLTVTTPGQHFAAMGGLDNGTVYTAVVEGVGIGACKTSDPSLPFITEAGASLFGFSEPVEPIEELAAPAGNRYYFTDRLVGGVADRVIAYGRADDQVLIGDWDGVRGDSLGVRRGRQYHLRNTISSGVADAVVTYGRSDDVVLVGDWDGDGVDTLGVRRGREYHLKNSISGGPADAVVTYGRSDDVVLVGDWDGDGVDTLGVRRGREYHLKNSIRGGVADAVVTYGRADDTVVVGDWDGDGIDTLGVRRGNVFHLKNTISGGNADIAFGYGKSTDIVLVGDWNGDRVDTLAVRRRT